MLVIAEGLTPYLRAVDGLALLRRITEYFASGEMLFDGYSRLGVWLLQRYGCVKVSGAQLGWCIDDPRELERAVPGLILDAELWYTNAPGLERHYSWLSPAPHRGHVSRHRGTTARPPVALSVQPNALS